MIMLISVNAKDFLEVLGKVASVEAGYELSVTEKGDGKGNHLCSIKAGDKFSMSQVSFTCLPILDVVAKKVCVGLEFANAIRALSAASDTISMNFKDAQVELTAGNALIPVKYKEKLPTLSVQNPKTEEHAMFIVNAKELKRAILQGASTSGDFKDDSNKAALNNALILPTVYNDAYALRIVSSSGYHGCSSYAALATIENGAAYNENFTKRAQEVEGYSIPACTLLRLASVLPEGNVTVYAFNKQLVIKTAISVYAFVLSEKQFPKPVLGIIDVRDFNFKFEANVKDVKVALDIISVNAADPAKSCCTFTLGDGKVDIKAVSADNRTKLAVSSAQGEVVFCVSVKYLGHVLKSMDSETFTMEGSSNTAAILVSCGSVRGFVLPRLDASNN